MPWRKTDVMEERMKFVCEYLKGEEKMAALCRAYGISRRTGYKWLERYRRDGIIGLHDRSSAPHGHPQAVPEELVAAILSVRHRHTSWGPRKVRAWLMDRHPEVSWPAASTIGALFDRAGLTVPRRRRRRVPARTAPLVHAQAANDVWTVDFKGWFKTGDGRRCDPLTMQDAASRYLLRCRVLKRLTCDHVWPQIDVAFRAYGLPRVMRSDNGAPFAGPAIGGLSRLAVKLIKAGVVPERIAPGKPQENGRHERLHSTLEQETARPPASNAAAQQRRFNDFQRIYNEERRSAKARRHDTMRRRRGPTAGACAAPTMAPITRSAACAVMATSSGVAGPSSSAAFWSANRSVSPRRRMVGGCSALVRSNSVISTTKDACINPACGFDG